MRRSDPGDSRESCIHGGISVTQPDKCGEYPIVFVLPFYNNRWREHFVINFAHKRDVSECVECLWRAVRIARRGVSRCHPSLSMPWDRILNGDKSEPRTINHFPSLQICEQIKVANSSFEGDTEKLKSAYPEGCRSFNISNSHLFKKRCPLKKNLTEVSTIYGERN